PADMVANAAFFYGILHSLVHERRPLWSRMSFEQATEAFQQCARWGLEARVRWPKVGRVRVADLLLEHLIPQAMEGLRSLGAEAAVAAHYGGILSERARTGRNGARWQIDTGTSLEVRGAGRPDALAEMKRLYRAAVHSGGPVHAWPVPARPSGCARRWYSRPRTPPSDTPTPIRPDPRRSHGGQPSHKPVRCGACLLPPPPPRTRAAPPRRPPAPPRTAPRASR